MVQQRRQAGPVQICAIRLNRLAPRFAALSGEYQERYGLDIPEWRVLATLGFRNDACSAQYIAHCIPTHKSTISPRGHGADDAAARGNESRMRDDAAISAAHDAKGKALYEQLIRA